jgi:hypothetical protein
MKKILVIFLLCCVGIAQAKQTVESPKPSVEVKETKTRSTAIWIGLGVVLLVVIVAAQRRRKNT